MFLAILYSMLLRNEGKDGERESERERERERERAQCTTYFSRGLVWP